MAELPWFPLYARDWLSGEGTSMMLPEQEGAFIRLLCVAWGDGSGVPSLPDDDKALAQISRLGSRWKRLGGLIRGQFTAQDGRLFNAKLGTIWAEQRERSQRLAENGRKGGRAKAGLEPGHSKALAKRYQSESESEAESERAVVEERTRAAVDGSVVGEPALTAIYVSIWANGAITEKWGEQPNPMTPSSAVELADEFQALGTRWEVVRDSIYRQCRESKLSRPPRVVNYFREGIRADIERHETRLTLAKTSERPPPTFARRTARVMPGAQKFPAATDPDDDVKWTP